MSKDRRKGSGILDPVKGKLALTFTMHDADWTERMTRRVEETVPEEVGRLITLWLDEETRLAQQRNVFDHVAIRSSILTLEAFHVA